MHAASGGVHTPAARAITMAERGVVGAVSELLHVFVIGADPVPVVNGRLAGGALAPLVRGGKPEGGEFPVLAEPGDGTEHLVARDAVDLLSHLVPSPVDLPSNRGIRPAADAETTGPVPSYRSAGSRRGE